MNGITDIDSALKAFINGAMDYAIATEDDNFKVAKRHAGKAVSAFLYIEKHGDIDILLPLLEHISIGVRLFTATGLIRKHEEKVLPVLEKIAKKQTMHPFLDMHALAAEAVMERRTNTNATLWLVFVH